MLRCVGCGERFRESDGYGDEPRNLCVSDLVCPSCGENLITMTEMTVTEFIDKSLSAYPRERWDEVRQAALVYNRNAYGIPDDKVSSIFEAIKKSMGV